MNSTYKQAIAAVTGLRASLATNNAVDHLLPQEIAALEALPYVPKQTVHYFNRDQAINLLLKVEIGLTLEWRYKALGSAADH